MHKSNMESINLNLKTTVKDARTLFHAASTLSGRKADGVRKRGMRLLDTALANAQPRKTPFTRNLMTVSANEYVQDNPWISLVGAACLGMMAGVFMGLNN